MMHEIYSYKFYLNARHLEEMMINKKIEIYTQPSTWEISISITNIYNQFTSFNQINDIIQEILKSYQDKLLDDIPPFDKIKPTIRNWCHFFKAKIEENLLQIGCVVLTYEICETPTRSYIYDRISNIEYYKYKHYLDASHSIKINDTFGTKHNHTFEINIIVTNNVIDFSKFKELDEILGNFLETYQNKYLNQMLDFENINPTLEAITNLFEIKFKKLLLPLGCKLSSIEIAETPSISYILN
jgi:6-pyruvoyltetrahydropterin/6-carboxytetrahydropterin synthase